MCKNFVCALPTPFDVNGRVDEKSYLRLISKVRNYADGLLALGTTAEAQLLTDGEKAELLRLTREACSLPLIAGIEQPATLAAAKEAERYAKLGADMLLVAPPSFCKCTAEGYVKHVEAIISASGLDVMLYNIPSRAGYALNVNAVCILTQNAKVKYVKDSAANTEFAQKIRPYVDVMCGSDENLEEYLGCGISGAVSVVGNYAPELTRRMLDCPTKDVTEQFARLARLAMLEINPIAIKYLLYKAGVFDTYAVRLPLTAASKQTQKKINKEILGLQ